MHKTGVLRRLQNCMRTRRSGTPEPFSKSLATSEFEATVTTVQTLR
jgi:hypothetical protein